jgi:Zn-dependent peptidase ImmA (M78 family)/DNA-binding XRE family transcriptional regulator
MSTVDLATLGARIAQARTRMGLSQVALADAISLDRSALAKIEGGSRRVSALELARIADELDERLEWFLTEPPASIVSHRNAAQPGAPSAVVDRNVERIARHVEFVLRHDDKLTLRETLHLGRPKTIADLERAASGTRELLGLDGTEPLLGVADRLAELGLLTFSLELGADAADAASILLPQGGVALVNGSRQVGRRRLALAHELGHYVFADEYNVDWRVAEQADTTSWEARLDRFARAVLLPAEGLRETWERASAQTEEPRRVAVLTASRFRVDMSTLARRLIELRVVGRTEADKIRAARTTKADIVELDLLVAPELSAPTLPRPYVQAVLRLYRGEVVSVARALDLLLGAWEEEDLPPLPPVPEDAIWELV